MAILESKNDVIAVSFDDWALPSTSSENKEITPIQVEAISLDDWVVEEVSLDSWVIGDTSSVKIGPKQEKPVVLVKSDLKSFFGKKKKPLLSKEKPYTLKESDLKKEIKVKIVIDEEPILLSETDLKIEEPAPDEPILVEEPAPDEPILVEEPAPDDPILVEEPASIEKVKVAEETPAEPILENIILPEPKEELRLEPQTPEPLTEPSYDIQLKQEDLASNHQLNTTGVLRLNSSRLRFNSTLDCLQLRTIDFTTEHNPVLRMSEFDLFSESDKTVLRLGLIDKAIHHRVVQELSDDFFSENKIERDEYGTILLEKFDLVHPEKLEQAEEPEKQGRVKRAKREVKKSMSDEQLVRYSVYVMIIITLLLPFTFHFKYSWVTVTPKRYEVLKEKHMDAFFRYRTKDSWHRFYGRRLLDKQAYEQASKDNGFLTWFLYANSNSPQVGDSYP